MKVFTRDYKTNHINSPIWGEYYGGMKSCVLDIEATGLDPRSSKVVLIGLLTETNDGVKATQFLAENHYEENKVLDATLNFLIENKIDYLITYNGMLYDIPFINTRLENNFKDNKIEKYNFDLYRFLKKCSVLPKKLKSLSQTSVESYFNIASERKDTITGKENIALFNEYSVSGNSTVEKIILTHNREDVLQLYKLMLICSTNDFTDIIDCNFHEAIAKYGFPVNNGQFTLRPQIKKSQLIINGDQNFNAFSAAYFPDTENVVSVIFSATTHSLEIIMPFDCKDNHKYIDIKKLNIAFENDKDLINYYLLLNSRTINLLSKLIMKNYI